MPLLAPVFTGEEERRPFGVGAEGRGGGGDRVGRATEREVAVAVISGRKSMVLDLL